MSGKQSLIFSQEDIEAQVIAVLENMTADWELEDGGKIDTETRRCGAVGSCPRKKL